MPDRLLHSTLDPDRLLEKLDDVERQRAQRPGDARVPPETYRQIRSELESPELRAHAPRATSVGPTETESHPPATVYLQPRSALSQFQSVVADCFEAVAVEAGELPPSERGWRRLLAELRDRLRRYGPCDIRWIEPRLLELVSELTHDKHRFVDARPATVPLGDPARVVIVGDWATGLPQARNVARSISAALRATPSEVDSHVIHLGDTYYSGTREEYRHLFLPLWPVAAGSGTGSWSLNGNHDMYAGGHGYFDVLLGDRRFARQRGCSYFCLGNEHWRFVGLDDSYTDPDKPSLAGSQVQWLSNLMDAAPGPGTILLSHHQPFSAWEVVTSALAGLVGQALAGRRVEAWLWGHEHRAAVYEPGIDYGDYHDFAEYTGLCGHGGVPNLVAGPEVAPPGKAVDARFLRWQNTQDYRIADDTWSLGGYAVIDLHGDDAQVQFFTETGQVRTDRDGVPAQPDRLRRLA